MIGIPIFCLTVVSGEQAPRVDRPPLTLCYAIPAPCLPLRGSVMRRQSLLQRLRFLPTMNVNDFYMKIRSCWLLSSILLLSLTGAVGAQSNTSQRQTAINQPPPPTRIELLLRENQRLRQERDLYKADLDQQSDYLNAKLKALSSDLTNKAEEDFYGLVNRSLLVLGIAIAVATLGGFWKLSDIITARIDQKMKDKEDSFRHISQRLFDELTTLKIKIAQKQVELDDLGQVMQAALESFTSQTVQTTQRVQEASDKAIAVCESKQLEVSSLSSNQLVATNLTAAELGSPTTYKEGDIPPSVTQVYPAGLDQSATEIYRDHAYYGAFAYFFARALRDPLSDTNKDGIVSLKEAVISASNALSSESIPQSPDVYGPESGYPLYVLDEAVVKNAPKGRILALLVGIDHYLSDDVRRLKGAANDVALIHEVLLDEHVPRTELLCHVLIGKEATRDRIIEEIEWLVNTSEASDTVLFFFSGHTTIRKVPGDVNQGRRGRRFLLPCDVRYDLSNAVLEQSILERLDKVTSSAKIYITG